MGPLNKTFESQTHSRMLTPPPTYRWLGWLALPFGSLKQEQDNETVSNRRFWQCSCTLWCGNISTEETEALGGMFWCSTVHRGSFKPTRLFREAGENSPPNSTLLKMSFCTALVIIWRIKLIAKKWLLLNIIFWKKKYPLFGRNLQSPWVRVGPRFCVKIDWIKAIHEWTATGTRSKCFHCTQKGRGWSQIIAVSI